MQIKHVIKTVEEDLLELFGEKYICEDRIEILKEKFKDKVPLEDMDRIFRADPTSQKEYSQWLLNQYVKAEVKELFMEDLSGIREALTTFHRMKNMLEMAERDINFYRDYHNLYEVVDRLKNLSSKRSEIKDLKQEGVKILLDSPSLKILIPLTYEAEKIYAANTRWCTTAEKWYKHYTNVRPLYIIIDKKTQEKFQFSFPTGQFMDAHDWRVNMGEFLKKYPEVEKVLSKEFNGLSLQDKMKMGLEINWDEEIKKSIDFIKEYRTVEGIKIWELGTKDACFAWAVKYAKFPTRKFFEDKANESHYKPWLEYEKRKGYAFLYEGEGYAVMARPSDMEYNIALYRFNESSAKRLWGNEGHWNDEMLTDFFREFMDLTPMAKAYKKALRFPDESYDWDNDNVWQIIEHLAGDGQRRLGDWTNYVLNFNNKAYLTFSIVDDYTLRLQIEINPKYMQGKQREDATYVIREVADKLKSYKPQDKNVTIYRKTGWLHVKGAMRVRTGGLYCAEIDLKIKKTLRK